MPRRPWALYIFAIAAIVFAVFAAVAYSNSPMGTAFNIPALTWVWASVSSGLVFLFTRSI